MSLKTVLSTLLTTAERSGQPARIEMRGGLKIDLRTDATFTFLQLSRAIPIEPSARELATVLDAWPYPIPDRTTITTTRARHAGRIYIMAAWPTPPRLPIEADPAVPAGRN